METLVEQRSNSMSKLVYNHHSFQVQNHVNNNPYQPTQPQEPDILTDSSDPCMGRMADFSSSEMMEMSQKPDNFQSVLNYIDQVLMEEDVLRNPSMFHQCLALQAAEKSFYDLLGQTYSPPPPPCESSATEGSSANTFPDYGPTYDDVNRSQYFTSQSFESIENASINSNSVDLTHKQSDGLFVRPFISDDCKLEHRLDLSAGYLELPKAELDLSDEVIQSHLLIDSREKKIRYREDSDNKHEEQSRKQSATYSDVFEKSDDDDVMFCEELLCSNLASKFKISRKARANRQESSKAFVDLSGMLTRCAKAVQSSDVSNAIEILNRIRQHSSPNGDGSERLAHYFANAIEARLAGTGIGLYTSFNRKRIAAADILKGYQAFVKACPFHRMSNVMANKSIIRVAQGATRLHIIDFGILYGFQWPCLIQGLSNRSGGPPTLRITGIDFPQPGFRPAERVEATGNHLARCCKKFNVPFEYNSIAKNWDSIELEDLRIEKNETLVVNCMYRLKNVPDETLDDPSPRDAVLDLIKRINPDLFVHGVLNGTYNAPFFVTRFREAMFHFSSLFDMFEATELRKDKHRLLFEQEVFGRDAMNVIACEGSTRIERPETFKQWQFRNMKAGFKQLPLHKDFLKEISVKVKFSYHREFLLDEEKNWMLQGWKGRVLYALSFWTPVGK